MIRKLGIGARKKDHQKPKHRQNRRDFGGIIIQEIRGAVPRGPNVRKALIEQQGKDESPIKWLKRLKKNLQLHSGIEPDSEPGWIFLKIEFVTKSWKDMRKNLGKVGRLAG